MRESGAGSHSHVTYHNSAQSKVYGKFSRDEVDCHGHNCCHESGHEPVVGNQLHEKSDKGGPSGGPVGNGNDVWDVQKNDLESAINNNYINHQLNNAGNSISWPAAAVSVQIRGAKPPPEPIGAVGEITFEELKASTKDGEKKVPGAPPIEIEGIVGEKLKIKGRAVAKNIVPSSQPSPQRGEGGSSGEMAVLRLAMDDVKVEAEKVGKGGEKRVSFEDEFVIYKNPATQNRLYRGLIAVPQAYLQELRNRRLTTAEWDRLVAVGNIQVPLQSEGGRTLTIKGAAVKIVVTEPPVTSVDVTAVELDESAAKEDETIFRKSFAVKNTGGGKIRGNISVSQPRWMEVEPPMFYSNESYVQLNVMLKQLPEADPDGVTKGKIVVESNGGRIDIPVTVKRRKSEKIKLEIKERGLSPVFAFEGEPGKEYRLIFRGAPGEIWKLDKLISGQTVTYNSDGAGLPLIPGVEIDYAVTDLATGAEVLKDSLKVSEDDVSFGWAP